MTTHLTMDLTGEHPRYKITDRTYVIFRVGQIVDLEAVAYTKSLYVFLAGPISGHLVELKKGTDWQPNTLAYNDMSRAKMVDSRFSEDLITSITMMRPLPDTGSYQIIISFQSLYPNQLRTALHHNEPFEFTPDLALSMVKQVERLTDITSRSVEVTTTPVKAILFDIDPGKEKTSNYVVDERHVLDVPNGTCFIQPLAGSFFKDSIVIKHPASGRTFVEGVDYAIVGMNEENTKLATHTSPVYNYIVIKQPIIDAVLVTYHAFGGQPTLLNYRELKDDVTSINAYLNDVNFVSEGNLGSAPLIVDIANSVNALEENMRILQGRPSYGDMTHGKTTLMKISAPDSKLHWYTIASLSDVLGGSPCTGDTMGFRLQTQLTHIQMHVMVSADITNPYGDYFNVDIVSENYPKGYIPYTDYTDIDAIIRPQFRIVWNNDGETLSGVFLQLGFELKGVTEETLAISDISGAESCWKLVDNSPNTTYPSDNAFALPNPACYWEKSNPKSRQVSMLVPYKGGHIAWAGAKVLNRPIQGWINYTLTNHHLPDGLNLKKIRRATLGLEERDGYPFSITIPFAEGSDHLFGHGAFTYNNQPAYINLEIYNDPDTGLTIKVNAEISAGTEAIELDLRHIIIYL